MTTFTLFGYRATNPFQLLAEGDLVRVSSKNYPTIALEYTDLKSVLEEKGLCLTPVLSTDSRFNSYEVVKTG